MPLTLAETPLYYKDSQGQYHRILSGADMTGYRTAAEQDAIDAAQDARLTTFESRIYNAWEMRAIEFNSSEGLRVTVSGSSGGLRILGYIIASVASHSEIFEIFVTAGGDIIAFSLTGTTNYNYSASGNVLTISKTGTSRSVSGVFQTVYSNGDRTATYTKL